MIAKLMAWLHRRTAAWCTGECPCAIDAAEQCQAGWDRHWGL